MFLLVFMNSYHHAAYILRRASAFLLVRNGGLSGRALGPTRCCKYNSLECVFILLHDCIISHAFVEKGKGGGGVLFMKCITFKLMLYS